MRDIETEELIEDQQQVAHQLKAKDQPIPQQIRELEAASTGLREKLLVAKQQLVGGGRPQPRRSPARRQVGSWSPGHFLDDHLVT